MIYNLHLKPIIVINDNEIQLYIKYVSKTYLIQKLSATFLLLPILTNQSLISILSRECNSIIVNFLIQIHKKIYDCKNAKKGADENGVSHF